jgi:spore protease
MEMLMSTENKDNLSYLRTDLACESELIPKMIPGSGAVYEEHETGGIKVATLTVENEEGERLSGRPIGKYITIFCGRNWIYSEDLRESLIEALLDAIESAVKSAAGKDISAGDSVLIAGLGNRNLTADAIGPLTVDGITVTRHMKKIDPQMFSSMNCAAVGASAPGVLAQTGIETAEIIKSAINSTTPDVLILVDALAARSCDRLTATIQVSDQGINPGSGIGNRRDAITKEMMGVPVITIGVPTIVDSSTLVYDALQQGGFDTDNISNNLREVLENGRSFFVSLKESDLIISQMAELISEAVNRYNGCA